MLSKHDQYSRSFSKCLVKAEHSPPAIREFWLGLADHYRTLLEYEDRHPTETNGGSGQRHDVG